MQPETARAPRGRTLPVVLVVLATVIGLVSIFGLWVKRQALETETWTDTSVELLESPAIREAVSNFIVTTIYDNVDVEAELQAKLPPQVQALAGPLAGGLQRLATDVAEEALQRPRVQALWEDANRTAHEKLIALLDDEGQFVSTTGGVVTLDLASLIDNVAAQVGIGAGIASKLPEGASEIEILKSDELDLAQTGVKALRTLAYVLTALTLLLYALAIYLARGRRRETLRMVGVSFAIMGILVLLVRNLAGDAVVSSLADNAAAEPAVSDTWEIGTSLLKETGQSILAYGLIILLAAWLAGPGRYPTAMRETLAPWMRQPRYAYGVLAFVLVLLFWWDPFISTHRLVPSLILILVFVIGTEAIRRQAIREFPDRVATGTSEGMAHAMATRMRESRETRVAGGTAAAAAAPAAAAPESRVDQLERLAKLRESGVLSDEELASEKARILSG